MPTATIGSPQTIALGAADALIVSCSAVDAVASVAGSTGFIGAPYELGRVVGETGRKFGPYGRAVSLIVSSLSGSITAEVSQPSRVGDGADALSTLQGSAAQGVVSEYLNGTLGGSILTISAPSGTDAGDVLTATLSAGWTVTGYQWTRDGADIAGATTSTYTILAGDAGKTIGCRAAGALYTATKDIPLPSTPSNALTLDALPITLDALSITLV